MASSSDFAVVVTVGVLASLLVSLTLTPMRASQMGGAARHGAAPGARKRTVCAAKFGRSSHAAHGPAAGDSKAKVCSSSKPRPALASAKAAVIFSGVQR